MSLRRQLNTKKDSIDESKIDDDILELKYIIKNKDLNADDLNILLYLIANSKFEGNKVNQVFELTLKLQYKLKLLEEKLNAQLEEISI